MNDRADIREPDVTPAVIADIPECLQMFIEMLVGMQSYLKGIKPLRISSNTLAHRFIDLRWNITLHHSVQYKQLFKTIEKECHILFQQLLKQEKIAWKRKDESYAFRIIKKYEDPDNIILEFKPTKENLSESL
ncbi:MAG: hypothetical protein RTU30_04185 [Candidatus Thorarchaeota archaeon]